MSIATLTGKADELLSYFGGQKTAIDNALAAALAAAPTREVVNYYLDNIAGDDANDGLTSTTPVATWSGLAGRMGSLTDRYFRSLRINIACDSTETEMDASLGAESSQIWITGAWNPRGIAEPRPRPQLKMMAYPGSGEASGFAVCSVFTGFNVALRASTITLQTPDDTNPVLPYYTHNGFLSDGFNQRLICQNSTIVINALPLNDQRLDLLYLFNCEIQRTAEGAGVPLIASAWDYSSRWYLGNITIPEGENLPDVLGITQWDANGYPVGIFSNADLSEVV
jgi:hypothetical protein